MADIIRRFHVRVIIGKGGMGAATREACRECGCIYVHAIGGAATTLAQTVRKVEAVHFLKEFGSAEAVWDLQVEGLEGVVTIDAHGGDLQAEVCRVSGENLERVLQPRRRERMASHEGGGDVPAADADSGI